MATSDGSKDWQPCTGRVLSSASPLPATIDQLPLPVQVVCAGQAVFVAYDDSDPFGSGGSGDSQPASARSGVLESTDGGASWRNYLTLPAQADTIRYLAASDATHLWALCGSNPPGNPPLPTREATYVLKTSDGGLHWTRLKVAIGSPGLPGMLGPPLLFTDDEHGWSTWDQTSAPLLRVTSDGGSSWAEPSQVYDASMGFFALDRLHAWDATGTSRQPGWTSGLYETSDGGRSWVPVPAFDHIALAAVYFANLDDGWVVAAGSGKAGTKGIYATADGGRHWRRELTPSASDQAWKLMGWQFCRAGDALFVGCQAAMFSRQLQLGAH